MLKFGTATGAKHESGSPRKNRRLRAEIQQDIKDGQEAVKHGDDLGLDFDGYHSEEDVVDAALDHGLSRLTLAHDEQRAAAASTTPTTETQPAEQEALQGEPALASSFIMKNK